MKSKLLILLTVLLIALLIAAGCGEDQDNPIETPGPISGLIYSYEENVILVVGEIDDVNIPREEWFEAGRRAVYFTITADTVIEHEGEAVAPERLARGQKVDVWHEGFLAESYPEQGGAVRIVIVDDSVAEEYQTDSGRFIGAMVNGVGEL